MPRDLSIRRPAAAAGVAVLLGAAAAVGAVLGTPAPAGASVARAATSTTGTAPSTGTAGPSGVPASGSPSFNPTESDYPGGWTSSPPCTPPSIPPAPTRWAPGDAVAIAGSGFEDGSPGGWRAFSGVSSVAVTDEAAATRRRSLLVDGLGTNAIVGLTSVRLPHDGWYKVSAQVRLKAPANGAFVQLRGVGGGGQVPGVMPVSADRWTLLVAYLRPDVRHLSSCGVQWQEPGDGGVELALVPPICAGGPDGATSLYVDDVSVTAADGATDGVPSPSTTPVVPVAPPIGCPPPPTPSTTTPTVPPLRCSVTHAVTSQWPNGYVATLVVRNGGLAATGSGWTLRLTLPDGGTVSGLWGAGTWSQNGPVVTVTGTPWASLPAGAQVTLGLVATGTPAPPSSASLDGTTCGISTT